MGGYEAHQMLMYAFWSYDFVAMLRAPSIAFRELKYPVKWVSVCNLIVKWSGRTFRCFGSDGVRGVTLQA